MKKRLTAVIIILVNMATGMFVCATEYFGSEFMTLSIAEKKWGVKTLSAEQFKSGELSKRAPMAVDIVKRSLFIGKSRKTIRQELGDPDSYFFSDTIYAYKIMPFPGKNMEIWHLVFIPDDKLEKISEVKIHKKCCYKLPF